MILVATCELHRIAQTCHAQIAAHSDTNEAHNEAALMGEQCTESWQCQHHRMHQHTRSYCTLHQPCQPLMESSCETAHYSICTLLPLLAATPSGKHFAGVTVPFTTSTAWLCGGSRSGKPLICSRKSQHRHTFMQHSLDEPHATNSCPQ